MFARSDTRTLQLADEAPPSASKSATPTRLGLCVGGLLFGSLLGALMWSTQEVVDEVGPPGNDLVLDGPIDHVERQAREPMLIEHPPSGTLFVSGFTNVWPLAGPSGLSSPALSKSTDQCRNWIEVDVGGVEDGAVGNSDTDLAVSADGTLFFVAMFFNRTVPKHGERISVGVSRDVGVTWAWTTLSTDRGCDRPWVTVLPDGRVHAIWNTGHGVHHAVSIDGGHSWNDWPLISPHGVSSHLAVGTYGELAVRVTPRSASGAVYDPDVDNVAVSVDGGHVWRTSRAPGHRSWNRSEHVAAAAFEPKLDLCGFCC